MHRTSKAGLGAAYLAGFAWGLNREYSVLVEMDADGSHAPEELHRLLDAVDGGADLAYRIALRRGPGAQLARAASCCLRPPMATPGCCWASRSTTSPRATVPTGARCWRRSTWPRSIRGVLLPDRPDLARHQQRLRGRRGPDHLHRARVGSSKMSGSNIREAMFAEWGSRNGWCHPRAPGSPDARRGRSTEVDRALASGDLAAARGLDDVEALLEQLLELLRRSGAPAACPSGCAAAWPSSAPARHPRSGCLPCRCGTARCSGISASSANGTSNSSPFSVR